MVVVLTVSTSSSDLLEVLQAGAVGLLVKGSDRAALPKALRAALDGEAVVPRKLLRPLLQQLVHRRGRTVVLSNGQGLRLTDREWTIASMLCERQSTLQMAERLQISPVTVRRHVSELTRKLGAPRSAAGGEAAASVRRLLIERDREAGGCGHLGQRIAVGESQAAARPARRCS